MGLNLDDGVDRFADEVGDAGPVTIAGSATRGGAVPEVRTVRAPAGIEWIQPAEMTVRCGTGTTVGALDAALAEVGQCVAMPPVGTIGGALAVGQSGIRRLGWGPVRDTLLQARYVSADGAVVKAGGPTVKNVSGFDLCRLLVGSRGTLGFLADVILRTRPRSTNEQWYRSERDPHDLLVALYRPTSVLWDGSTTWVLLDGHPADMADQAARCALEETDGPPDLPPHRSSVPPSALAQIHQNARGRVVAEVGVGIVHSDQVRPRPPMAPEVADLHRRIKHEFDPTGRLNPGLDLAG